MSAAASIALITYRGDSPIFPFTLKTGTPPVAVDITGYTFEMTVDTREFPDDNSTELFTVAGTIVVAAAGTFQFQPTSTDTNQTIPTDDESIEFFYDIGLVNGSEKVTIVKGTFTINQDIGKS